MSAWLNRGALVVDSEGRPVSCPKCPCIGAGDVLLACCDSFGACVSVAISKALFATVYVYDDILETTLLATFTVPINYATTPTYSNFGVRPGWYGCTALDPDVDWFDQAAILLFCLGGEFKVAINPYVVSGHTLCDGHLHSVGSSGSVDLVASPFSVANTGVPINGPFAGPRGQDVWVRVLISE
jgi:hypothetical protein